MQTTQPTSEKTLQTSLRNTMLAGAIGMFFFMTVSDGPIPLLLEKLGASGIAIGLSVTLLQLGMLAQIPTAFFTERLTQRKQFWVITTIMARVSIALPGIYLLLCPEQHTPIIWTTLLSIATFSILFQAGVPSWFSWMADLVPETIRSAFWSKRQGYAMIAAVISVTFTGWFLDQFPESSLTGFGWVLIIASTLGVLDGIIHWYVQEPPQTPTNLKLSPTKRIISPLQNRDFLFFTLAMCAWVFALGFFGPFTNVYLKTTFGLTYTQLSAIQLSTMLSGVITCFSGGPLIERVGIRTYALAIATAIPLFSGLWYFLDGTASIQLPLLGNTPQPVVLLCACSLLAGGLYAAIGMIQFNLLSTLAPTEGRTMAMAVHWFLVGIISSAGPIIGGWLKDYLSAHPIPMTLYNTPFSYFHLMLIVHACIVWTIMIPLLTKIQKKNGDWPLKQAFTHIFIFAPFRSVRDGCSLQLLTTSITTGKNTLQTKRKSAETTKKTSDV